MNNVSIKIVLVGGAGVGKSTFIKKFNGVFKKSYRPTRGVEVHTINFKTNYGNIEFIVWDCAGQDCYGGLRDGYYIMAQGCIAMADQYNQSITKAKIFIDNVLNIENNIPVSIVINKCELSETIENHNKFIEKTPNSIFISVKNNYNLEASFLYLAREITKNPDLIFIK